MQLPVVRKTAGGAPSTDEEVLTKLAQDYPLPQVLLEYRGLSKLKSTYTDKLPRMVNPATGRVHTHYSQAAVITGRLASSDPNLQNIPVRTEAGRRVRRAFIAENGMLLSADYSQIELRIMAHVSDDANLQRAFAAGEDIHRATASEVFGVSLDQVSSEQRRAAKAINFGLIYGMGVFGLASNLGITRDAAQAYIDRYFARYPGVAMYMEETRRLAREQGYVETVFGRRLQLPEIRGASGPRRRGAERAAINAPMQGTAADLIKMAMVAVQDWLQAEGMQTRMIMQVHDELVLEAPDAEIEAVREALPRLMCNVAELRVPLVAEVGVGRTGSRRTSAFAHCRLSSSGNGRLGRPFPFEVQQYNVALPLLRSPFPCCCSGSCLPPSPADCSPSWSPAGWPTRSFRSICTTWSVCRSACCCRWRCCTCCPRPSSPAWPTHTSCSG